MLGASNADRGPPLFEGHIGLKRFSWVTTRLASEKSDVSLQLLCPSDPLILFDQRF